MYSKSLIQTSTYGGIITTRRGLMKEKILTGIVSVIAVLLWAFILALICDIGGICQNMTGMPY